MAKPGPRTTYKYSDHFKATAVALDHQTGYSVVVLFPYQLVAAELEFGSPFAQAGKNGVFF